MANYQKLTVDFDWEGEHIHLQGERQLDAAGFSLCSTALCHHRNSEEIETVLAGKDIHHLDRSKKSSCFTGPSDSNSRATKIFGKIVGLSVIYCL